MAKDKAKAKKRTPECDPTEIQEVAQFIDAEKVVTAFRTKHAKVFAQHGELVEQRNTLRQEADKIVRGSRVSCGPWQIMGITEKVNVGKLFEELGEENFRAMGGAIITVREPSFDKEHLLRIIKSDQLPKEVIEEVYSEEYRYKAPKDIDT